MSDYPESGPGCTSQSARESAINYLDALIDQAQIYRDRLRIGGDVSYGNRNLITLATSIQEQFAVLETLRTVREWHVANRSIN